MHQLEDIRFCFKKKKKKKKREKETHFRSHNFSSSNELKSEEEEEKKETILTIKSLSSFLLFQLAILSLFLLKFLSCSRSIQIN
jgi:hypothetical protein